MKHFDPIDAPCIFCKARQKDQCRTRSGRRYYRTHVKRKELAGYLNDGTIAKLLRNR